ncbi:MAG: hypothetical protein RLZZ293_721 [Pseudomonadota bacterium]|jgi:enoyl-[acyl-carrier protein] reductase I
MLDLSNKKGLIIGVANDASIAYGCAKSIVEAGCKELIVTYLNDKALPHVQKACQELNIKIIFTKCDVQDSNNIEDLLNLIKQDVGQIDFIVHSIAFADKDSLYGRVVDCSWQGFASSYHISSFSFIEICRLAEQVMPNGGAVITMTYLGAEKVIDNYGIMGVIKASLEASVRYVANELATSNIRVYAISPGVIKTRAASGLKNFSELLEDTTSNAPMSRPVTIKEVGNLAAFLCSDLATGMTGDILFVDGGYHIK